jgi:hypothetical protein
VSAGWAAAAIATLMMLGTCAAVLWRGGRRDGRIDAVLERLADIAGDHETRLRAVEHTRAGGRPNPASASNPRTGTAGRAPRRRGAPAPPPSSPRPC